MAVRVAHKKHIRMAIKPYRIKHKPTGLYYKPSTRGTNLSRQGKSYITSNNFLHYSDYEDMVIINISPMQYEEFKDVLPPLNARYSKTTIKVPIADFVIEYL